MKFKKMIDQITRPVVRRVGIGKRVCFYGLALSGILAVVFTVRYYVQLLPLVKTEIVPTVLNAWPEGEAVRYHPTGIISTESGKMIKISDKDDAILVIIDPTRPDPSIAEFLNSNIPVMVTKTTIFAHQNGGAGQVRAIPLTQFIPEGGLQEDFVIDRAKIEELSNTAINFLSGWIGILVFLGVWVAMFISLVLALVISSVVVATLISFLQLFRKKGKSWNDYFYAALDLGPIAMIVKAIIMALLLPASGVMTVVLAGRLAQWMIGGYPVDKGE